VTQPAEEREGAGEKSQSMPIEANRPPDPGAPPPTLPRLPDLVDVPPPDINPLSPPDIRPVPPPDIPPPER
jgi:hypothetical protein